MKTIFITGGSTGIGAASVAKFAKVNDCSIEDYWDAENKLYARGEAGKPEEVAELVYFLASDSSSFCTGGHYLVDGGLVAR